MTLYTLRVTYLTTSRRAKVKNVRDLTWTDAMALKGFLDAEPSTLSTETHVQPTHLHPRSHA